MKKSELVELFSKRILNCTSEFQAELEVENIVREINSITIGHPKRKGPNSFKVDILNQIIERLKVHSLNESQESDYLMSSFSEVLEYLKPAVVIIRNTVEELKTNETDVKINCE